MQEQEQIPPSDFESRESHPAPSETGEIRSPAPTDKTEKVDEISSIKTPEQPATADPAAGPILETPSPLLLLDLDGVRGLREKMSATAEEVNPDNDDSVSAQAAKALLDEFQQKQGQNPETK